MEAGLTTGGLLASQNPVTLASHGAVSTLIVTICHKTTRNYGEATTIAGTREAKCRLPGASPWTLESEWTFVIFKPAVSTGQSAFIQSRATKKK